MSDVRAKNLEKRAHVDIVAYPYLFRCEAAGCIVPLQPRDLLSSSQGTKMPFVAAFDQWGDAFFEEVSVAHLREILNAIPETALSDVPEELTDALARHPRFVLPDNNTVSDAPHKLRRVH